MSSKLFNLVQLDSYFRHAALENIKILTPSALCLLPSSLEPYFQIRHYELSSQNSRDENVMSLNP